MSTIFDSSDVVSASKMITSSSRLRNSGLNEARTAFITALPLRLLVQGRVGDEGRAEVRREDEDRVAEVHGPPLAVGQPPVVQNLEQHVEDLGVRLLHLVEQHHAVGTPPHRLGELAALLVADVAGRRAHQARDRVLLAVLAHVDADHRPLVVEQELGQRLGQLGLADAGRAEEQERARRPVRVGDAGPRPAHRVGDRLHRAGLADDPAAELGLHPQQLAGLALEQAPGGDARPGGHDIRHVVRADLFLHHRRGAQARAAASGWPSSPRSVAAASAISASSVGISPYSSLDAVS